MVYLEDKCIGVESLIKSYFENLFPELLNEYRVFIKEEIEWILYCVFNFIKKYCKSPIKMSELNIVKTFLNLFDSIIGKLREEKEEKKKVKNLLINLTNTVIFVIIWSAGVSIIEDSRKYFNKFFIDLVKGENIFQKYKIVNDQKKIAKKINIKFPLNFESIYDLLYDVNKNIWVDWMSGETFFEISPQSNFHEINVPTIDSSRNSFLLHRFAKHEYYSFIQLLFIKKKIIL